MYFSNANNQNVKNKLSVALFGYLNDVLVGEWVKEEKGGKGAKETTWLPWGSRGASSGFQQRKGARKHTYVPNTTLAAWCTFSFPYMAYYIHSCMVSHPQVKQKNIHCLFPLSLDEKIDVNKNSTRAWNKFDNYRMFPHVIVLNYTELVAFGFPVSTSLQNPTTQL